MTIWCLGSLNCDHIYEVPHLPRPGETLASTRYVQMAGGKGLNQSIAARRAGADVHHIGAVGREGGWLRDRLAAEGVDISAIGITDAPTGHAIVQVAQGGENLITIFAGANHTVSRDALTHLSKGKAGDWFLTQNETNGQSEATRLARAAGMSVAYCAAPFNAAVTMEMLPHVDLLVLNAVEMRQLEAESGLRADQLGVKHVVVSQGAAGCRMVSDSAAIYIPAKPIKAVDSTGAGDVLTGYLVAGLDSGMNMVPALNRAMSAAALMVMRRGTADVIPFGHEIT